MKKPKKNVRKRKNWKETEGAFDAPRSLEVWDLDKLKADLEKKWNPLKRTEKGLQLFWLSMNLSWKNCIS